MLSAETIAHAVLGLDPVGIAPRRLVSGAVFDEAGIHGVVESDFFDWVVEVPGGVAWVRTLARRLRRFRWDTVQHDVLKVLYESVIRPETRKKLGEYYTPDWLAEQVVSEVVTDALSQTVLDPACGSGTFLFHAVRRYLRAADEAGQTGRQTLDGLTSHVMGMDLHPVAVTLARVTYLLAIGKERLAGGERGTLHVPVYLGDSLQWQFAEPDLWTAGNLSIRTDSEPDLFDSELLFPEELLEEPDVFDRLVDAMAHKAADREPGSDAPDLVGLYDRFGVDSQSRTTLDRTFEKLCHLNDEGRDHIWSYYVRNLARPNWLSRGENKVDALVGNPPWLAYRHMTEAMQDAFRTMSSERGLWHGATVATHQDLSALFVARSVELYLQPAGRFGMVMPNAALDRAQFEGFRSGSLGDLPGGAVNVSFSEPWDLRRLRPHFFPRGSAVVFGTRAEKAGPMPETADSWTGKLGDPFQDWAGVLGNVTRERTEVYPASDSASSRYRQLFTQGAILAPRLLFVVSEDRATPLGVPEGQTRVRSSRNANEKKPWKPLPDHVGVVESQFVRELVAGEAVVPYRVVRPLYAVIPADEDGLLDGQDPRVESYPGLARWWRDAEAIWTRHRKSERLTLRGQLDYRGKLSKQLGPVRDRVVYSKSGMHMVAARVGASTSVVNNSLYWAPVQSEVEALFLCAVLNSAALTTAVRPLMSYGKDERHFDNYVWQLGIPDFSEDTQLHAELSELGREMEAFVAGLSIDPDTYFVTARKAVRSELANHARNDELEARVTELLGAVD